MCTESEEALDALSTRTGVATAATGWSHWNLIYRIYDDYLRQLLLCRVALGKSFLQFSAMKMAHAPPGHHSVVGRFASSKCCHGGSLRLFCLVGYEICLKRRPQMMWKDMYHLHLMRRWINFSFLFARWVFSDRNILHLKEACWQISRKKLNVRFSMKKIKSCRTKIVFLALMLPAFFVEASLFIHVRQKFTFNVV